MQTTMVAISSLRTVPDAGQKSGLQAYRSHVDNTRAGCDVCQHHTTLSAHTAQRAEGKYLSAEMG